MKNRVWSVAAIGVGFIVLAGPLVFRLSREWRPLTPHTVVMSGPDEEATKRTYAKEAIAREVLRGDKSLLAAAAAFRRLDDGASPRLKRAREIFPDAASDDEAYCRLVIRSVDGLLRPKWGLSVTKSLQEELETRNRDGTLYLDETDDPTLNGGRN